MIYLALPHHGGTHPKCVPGAREPVRRAAACGGSRDYSLLGYAFNLLWCEALNLRPTSGVTRFAMLHADVSVAPGWLDDLADELDRTGADVLSVVLPLKDDTGATSTAAHDPRTQSMRRLTLREVHRLPPTFGSEALPPGHTLMVNTGCMVCRVDRLWADRFDGFSVRDRVVRDPATGKFLAKCLPEDWGFSMWAHANGLKVMATRGVPAGHCQGDTVYENTAPWGTWETDLGGGDL